MEQQHLILGWDDVYARARKIAEKIYTSHSNFSSVGMYGVPTGGIFAAQAVLHESQKLKELQPYMHPELRLVSDVGEACVVVDDILESGQTRDRVMQKAQDGSEFYCLYDKSVGGDQPWYAFPWETMDEGHPSTVESNLLRVLQFIGDDPKRNGLRETPARVVRSYETLYSGYKKDPGAVLKTFEDISCDEMIVLRGIEFYSMCEHHMLPFFGKAHIAYIPQDDRVVGISKLARVLEIFSRQLQVQERLTSQITECLDKHLKPLGSACVIEGQHLCMMARGVSKQDSVLVTSSLTGVFKGSEVRSEFFSIVNGGGR